MRLRLTDGAAVEAMLQWILQRHGRLDVVVNNAGICPFRHVLEVTEEEFHRIMDVNVTSIFLVSTGHGVITDRLNSLMVTAPVFAHVMGYLFGGFPS